MHANYTWQLHCLEDPKCQYCHTIPHNIIIPIGDLAVDWIANRIYWTIRDEGKIEELDLETEQRRIVLQSEGTGVFSGLAIYPYPNNG